MAADGLLHCITSTWYGTSYLGILVSAPGGYMPWKSIKATAFHTSESNQLKNLLSMNI